MKPSSGRKHLVWVGIAGAVLTILLSSLFEDLFRGWEWETHDMRFKWRGPAPTDPGLIMIDADDSSAGVYGRWPWKRSVHAELIKFLKDSGVKTVAYDVLFATAASSSEDEALMEATRSFDPLIFPVASGLSDPATEGNSNHKAAADTSVTAGYWLASDPVFPLSLLKVERLGHIAANRDEDGVIRRVPLLINLGENKMPSLAFRAVLDYLDIPDFDIEIDEHTNTTIVFPQ